MGARVTVAVGLSALLLGLGAYPAAADPHDDQRRVDRQLAQTKSALEVADDRVEAAALAYQDATHRLPEAARLLAEARGVLAGASARAEATGRRARQAAADARRAGVAFEEAWQVVDRARAEIGTFAADAYRGRRIAALGALLTADSPSDIAVGVGYLECLARQRRAALARVTVARLAAKEDQNAAILAQRRADAANAEARAALAEAAGAEAAAADAARQFDALAKQRKDALAVAELGRAATLARYEELQAESERIAAEIRALARGQAMLPPAVAPAPVLRAGARLPMPVAGWKSSDFGMRFDPYYHVWRLHVGVDLVAPGGTPIYAAAVGRVFRAGWKGGYGLYTCIYHGLYRGQGLATCYAHQSVLLVGEGQAVRRGQLIGRVGTTGASTGDHLHFEVRLDGEPVDPVNWLPACLC